jgi:Mor family transcriptional regulator
MPKPVDWTPLVPRALAALREMTAAVVDRTTLERLLKIHRRTAIRLLHQLGGQQLGKTLLIPREQLMRELESYLPADASGASGALPQPDPPPPPRG